MRPTPCARRRRQFLVGSLALTGLSLLAGCGIFPPRAQAPPKVHRIGLLFTDSPEGVRAYTNSLREGLRELGYVEGQNTVIEERYADGRAERLPDLATDLLRLNVEVVVVGTTPNVLAVKQASGTIPIVFTQVADPVAQGYAVSLARPGGNITGLSSFQGQLSRKRLQLLKEAVPQGARVAVIVNAGNPATAFDVRELEAAGRLLGVELQTLEFRGPGEVERALEAATRGRADAVIAVGLPYSRLIADSVAKSGLPWMCQSPEDVAGGCLMAYGVDRADLYRRAAVYVDKILKGTKPGDLPIEQPTTFDCVVNLKTAQALGLSIPQSVLQQSTEVIQ